MKFVLPQSVAPSITTERSYASVAILQCSAWRDNLALALYLSVLMSIKGDRIVEADDAGCLNEGRRKGYRTLVPLARSTEYGVALRPACVSTAKNIHPQSQLPSVRFLLPALQSTGFPAKSRAHSIWRLDVFRF